MQIPYAEDTEIRSILKRVSFLLWVELGYYSDRDSLVNEGPVANRSDYVQGEMGPLPSLFQVCYLIMIWIFACEATAFL